MAFAAWLVKVVCVRAQFLPDTAWLNFLYCRVSLAWRPCEHHSGIPSVGMNVSNVARLAVCFIQRLRLLLRQSAVAIFSVSALM